MNEEELIEWIADLDKRVRELETLVSEIRYHLWGSDADL